MGAAAMAEAEAEAEAGGLLSVDFEVSGKVQGVFFRKYTQVRAGAGQGGARSRLEGRPGGRLPVVPSVSAAAAAAAAGASVELSRDRQGHGQGLGSGRFCMRLPPLSAAGGSCCVT